MRARSSGRCSGFFLLSALIAANALAAPAKFATSSALGGPATLIFQDGFESGDVSIWALEYSVWLPPGTVDVAFYVEFAPLDTRADLVFAVDSTGSMDGEIVNLRNSLITITNDIAALVPDMNFAAASWRDFPLDPFGIVGDLPWDLGQEMTASAALVQTALNALTAAGGNDFPESGYEALYQLGAGTGISWTGGSVPAYSGPGFGGVGFRAGTARLAIHVTDAASHLDSDYAAVVPDAHSKAEALAALGALGVRVLSIQSLSDATATAQLDEIAVATGAEVPPCAFELVPGCVAGQCCTGVSGAGVLPGPNGRCPLRYQITDAGTGIGIAIVNGIETVIQHGMRDVVAGATDDIAGGPDTTCFIDRIEADAFFPPPAEPEASCVPVATPGDIGGSGYDDGFSGFATGSSGGTTGSRLRFVVHASNGCIASTSVPQLLPVQLNLTDFVTGALLDQVLLNVLVPPTP